MPRSEAENRAIKKYDKEKIDRMMIRVKKGERERIAEYAALRGESANAYIVRAIHEAMARDDAEKGTK